MDDLVSPTSDLVSDGDEAEKRRPRIALMGEFSAGKSTLSNLLIGSNPLPVKVTATQLPPVWISHGDEDAHGIDLEGNAFPVDLDRLEAVDLANTALIRIYLQADILELCDLIDMPGISDPNMPAEVWQNVISEADGVLWCTHATQAWRQSEAAVWDQLAPDLAENSLLLVTRIDKITSDKDRRRLMQRVRRETEELFADVLPVSLIKAMAAEDDPELWQASGADVFVEALLGLIGRLDTSTSRATDWPGLALKGAGRRIAPKDASAVDPSEDKPRIVPRRVSSASMGALPRRPTASDVPMAAAALQRQARGI
ncbi:MAG: dynamin family protein [Pseudomonadota bacterium]